ncbi:MAG: hypothetical protein ACTTKL_00885 [Treponema sp.]
MYIAIIIGIVIISVGAIIFFKGTKGALQPIVIDVLSAETVITFFKRPEVLQKLKQNTNLLAVAVKGSTKNIITLACFNKEENRVEEEFVSYRFTSMAEDLKTMFGDKPMIVLN